MHKSTFPRVLITGLGCVSPLGNDVPTFWNKLINGKSGITDLTKIDTEGLRNTQGGEVRGLRWSDYGEEGDCDEATQFAVVATHEAIADAQLTFADLHNAGIIFSTNFGGAASWEAACEIAPEADKELFEQFTLENAADYVADEWQIEGPRITLTDACSSGATAIGAACDWLRLGRAQIALCGGHDALGLSSLAGLSIMRTITPELCRPFDANRNGTIFGEGAGILVLETWESAHRRNAKVYGEILGWSCNNNAYHLTAPDKNGAGLAAVMQQALENADIKPDQIDYINAHGTGTKYNDLAETLAIKSTFGARAKEIPVSSIKAATSHTMGAAGALEAIAVTQALLNQRIPPTLNYQTPDPECDLDYVPNEARSAEMRIALSNSSGIGGNNACLVIGVVEQSTFDN